MRSFDHHGKGNGTNLQLIGFHHLPHDMRPLLETSSTCRSGWFHSVHLDRTTSKAILVEKKSRLGQKVVQREMKLYYDHPARENLFVYSILNKVKSSKVRLIFWQIEHGDPLRIFFLFPNGRAINNNFWPKKLARSLRPKTVPSRLKRQAIPETSNCPALILSLWDWVRQSKFTRSASGSEKTFCKLGRRVRELPLPYQFRCRRVIHRPRHSMQTGGSVNCQVARLPTTLVRTPASREEGKSRPNVDERQEVAGESPSA